MKIKNFKHIFKFQAIVVIFIAFFENFVIFSQFLKKIHEFVGYIYNIYYKMARICHKKNSAKKPTLLLL
jgi:hypothetical protein